MPASNGGPVWSPDVGAAASSPLAFGIDAGITRLPAGRSLAARPAASKGSIATNNAPSS